MEMLKLVYPGGQDNEGRLVLNIQLSQPASKEQIETSVKYVLDSFCEETLANGVTAVVDARKTSWRLARNQIKFINALMENKLQKVIVLKPDVFSVQSCAKSDEKGEFTFTTMSRLNKYLDVKLVSQELGGERYFSYDEWLKIRMTIDSFKRLFEKTSTDIRSLSATLEDSKKLRASGIEEVLENCKITHSEVQKLIKKLFENGNEIESRISEMEGKEISFVSQDVRDSKENVKKKLVILEKQQMDLYSAWNDLEKSLKEAKQFEHLEEGVASVTTWILSTAESLLNGQLKIGRDVQTAEKLRLDHEIMEFQCWKIYGKYGELSYKISNFTGNKESYGFRDLISQRDFMDFVCRSFATRLERRRNILITSVRFFRLVAEYFHRTAESFNSFIAENNDSIDYVLAVANLQKIKSIMESLEKMEKTLIKEGEKLSDILSMPVKDALGKEIDVNYSEEIAYLCDILNATKTNSKIFKDNMDLQRVTLERIIHCHKYEDDATVAIKWIESLYGVMVKSHCHVGCNKKEIHTQKSEYVMFQDTGKNIYDYGLQLLHAALVLREASKMNTDNNKQLTERLQKTWQKFHLVSQEQMTRLRVTAVFYRSVEDQCNKLEELKSSVLHLNDIEDADKRKSKLRKYLSSRERLLLEIGRMVRLGRLLKNRLKDPLILDSQTDVIQIEDLQTVTVDNTIACEAIAEKLLEISKTAESLDSILSSIQEDNDVLETSDAMSPTLFVPSKSSSANNSDDWGSSVKSSTEDESFVTASEMLTSSRSESYHTASESRTSPWYTDSMERSSVDFDSSDAEQPSFKDTAKTAKASPTKNLEIPSQDQDDEDEELMNFPPILNDSGFESKSEKSIEEVINKIENSTVPSDSQLELNKFENKIYTIFESPASTPSQNGSENLEDGNAKKSDCDLNNNLPEISGLSYYYQNIITKQIIKTCL